MVSLVIVFISFFILFGFIIYHKRKIENKENDIDDKKYYYAPIINSYKHKYWYWELILFIRRSLFAFVFIVFDNNNLKMGICIILLIYLFINWNCMPFKLNDVNIFESYLIATIIAIIFIDSGTTDIQFRNIVISLLILFPICWYIYFIISKRKALKNKKNGNKIVDIELKDMEFDRSDILTSKYRPSKSDGLQIETDEEEEYNDSNHRTSKKHKYQMISVDGGGDIIVDDDLSTTQRSLTSTKPK